MGVSVLRDVAIFYHDKQILMSWEIVLTFFFFVTQRQNEYFRPKLRHPEKGSKKRKVTRKYLQSGTPISLSC